MKARYEIGILFLFHNLLKFERKPSKAPFDQEPHTYYYKSSLVSYFYLVSVYDILRTRGHFWGGGAESPSTYLDDDD